MQEKHPAAPRMISIPLHEDLYRKVEKHAEASGERIQDCIASAVSEAIELWDDYDRIISTLNTKERIPVFKL